MKKITTSDSKNKKINEKKNLKITRLLFDIGEPPIEDVKQYNGDKFQHKILKRHEIAKIGYTRGLELGVKFDSPITNVAEDKQVYAGLNYLGMIEGWQLVCIDKYISDIDGSNYGLDEFYFKRLINVN